MRILVVCHYYPPEIGAPQARLSELARRWSERGEDVTVLTGLPNHPTGVVPPEYRGRTVIEEERDGVRVVRTWLYATPNEGTLKKTLGHLSFMVTSVLLGMRRVEGADVVVVSSPTFFSIFSAWWIARRRRARFVVEVRDLWPAIFVELGVLTNRRAIAALERVELWAYRAADAVVVVSEGFRDDLVRRGVPAEKVTVVRNGVDVDRFDGRSADAPVRSRLGAGPDDVLVLYAGAHGISHALEQVVDASLRCRDPRVRFALVGEGAAKQEVIAHARAVGADRVRFLPGVPRHEMPDVVAAADVCLVPLRDVPLFTTFIPSKLFEFLAAARPVIGAVRGESASILRDAGAVVVEPEDADALAEAIDALAGDPERRAAMGAAGRRAVVDQHDRRLLADGYLELLGRLHGGSQPPHGAR